MITNKEIINRKYNELIMKYMAQGYVVNSQTMHSHMSDAPIRIDMYKGNDFLRIYINDESAYFEDGTKTLRDKYYYDGYVFYVVAAHKHFDHASEFKDRDTIWTSNLEIIEEYKFYSTTYKWRRCGYTDSLEDIEAVCKKQIERIRARHEWDFESKTYYDIKRLKIAFKRVKREPRTKTIHLENIQSVEKCNNGEYKVNYVTNSGKKCSVYIN